MVTVRVENLVKNFGDTTAVDNVNFKIEDEEFFVLLGPSGCGKSTTLNIIAGLEKPTSGHIYFDDKIVDDIPPENRNIAMVFQSYALYPHMDVFNNIAFGLKLRKIPKNEVRQRIDEAAGMLQIQDILQKKPYELSGGQRQRVALARAIVRKPQVFLLDEPMSNIDAKLRVAVRADLIRLQKLLKVTTIYVTHDQVEAMTMGDRIAVLDKGKLIQLDSPVKVFNQPVNIFVGGFIGSPPMNFLEATFDPRNEKKLEGNHFTLDIPSKISNILKKTGVKDLILGIRPQNIDVFTKSKEKSIQTEVYAVEPLGTETIADLNIGDKVIKAVADPSFDCNIGDPAWIRADIDKVHLFDKKTGQIILK